MTLVLTRLRSIVDRLGFRLAIVLAVALLPLMIVSIVRSQSVVNQALARSQAALVGETLRAVQQEVIIIERARAVAQALSRSVPLLLDELDLCNWLMREKLNDTVFSFAGFYYTNGDVPCSSAPEPFSLGMTDVLERQLADPRPSVQISDDAPVSGTSIVFATYPVLADDGELLGFTSVSVPHHRLQQAATIDSVATFLTLNASGEILTAPEAIEEAQLLLPQLHPDLDLTNQPSSFRAVGNDGIERLYALVPVVNGELFALSTWPLDAGLSGNFYLSNPALFPGLMWLASLVVAWFATSLFVTRHVVRLQRAMQEFAASRHTNTPYEFANAPGELRNVAETFRGMTDKILHDEAQIEDTMRQKDILLREVHHRVKNNLQLIASIMSMQMRKSRSAEVKHLMQSLHDRVNSLATIHQNLYQTSGQADISMDEHLDAIVRQVVRMGAARDKAIDLETEFASIRLNPDQAVPLSLFVTEAVTNAMKYIGAADGQKQTLRITLTELPDDQAKLTIANTITARSQVPDAATSTGLGSELMEAFAEQLDGTFSTQQEGDVFKVRLEFEIEPLDAKP